MKLLPLEILGSHPKGNKVHFGLMLPWVSRTDGNRLFVKIIKEEDQLMQNIPPHRYELTHSILQDYDDYWSTEITIDRSDRKSEESAWGEHDRYLYRYELESPLLAEPLDWIIDPFAREFGMGRLSAFSLFYEDHPWDDIEYSWKTPKLRDLIVYELMIQEFGGDLYGAAKKLPYLKDIGINCIEVMPVSNVSRSVDWGYEPIGMFGPDERFGSRKELQKFIQTAHENGIAVILDMVYGHTSWLFAYEYVYSNLRFEQNPFMGTFAQDKYGASADFNREFTRNFFYTVNHFWLDRYHADGIRYDCVADYYDGPEGNGYASLAFHTRRLIRETAGTGHWQRFFDEEDFNLIQCAEYLDNPFEILRNTYSNCTWQDSTLESCWEIARGNFGRLYELGMQLGLTGYPDVIVLNGEVIRKTVFQYIENHDHPRFICAFGKNPLYKDLILEGKRENWRKLRPYLTAILLAKGIPMLFQGQEILENYDVPDDGPARIGTFRPVRWEFFYTPEGKEIMALVRNLITLRKTEPVFTMGSYYFYNDWDQYQKNGILVFTRTLEDTVAVIALNFSEEEQKVTFHFETGGSYFEQTHRKDNLLNLKDQETREITIPASSCKVWLKKVQTVTSDMELALGELVGP